MSQDTESQQGKQARQAAEARNDDLQEMARDLASLADSHGVCVLGYIWGGKTAPVLMRFSNVTERGRDIKRLLDRLYEMESQKAEAGEAQTIAIPRTFQA